MKKITRLSLLLIMLLFSNVSFAKTIYVHLDPPTVRFEIKTKKPASNYIWIQGNWEWSSVRNKFKWKKGCWKKNKPNKIWISGRWKNTPRGWTWIKGYWK